MSYLILIIATAATSIVSGILSMAGGLILMGVFGFLLSVPAAMVLHGVAQAVSNGSRIWFHRRHIRTRILIPYTFAALLVLAAFVGLAIVPDKGVMFILIGLFPFAALVMPQNVQLDVERPATAFACGLMVTAAQMLAGASGPVLDVFYVGSRLSRFEVLATKAVTQTLGHVIKLGYYAFFIGEATALPLWIFPAVAAAAIAGNWIGMMVVHRLHDDDFRRYGRIAIMAIGAVYMVKGIAEMTG